ncbi:MAG: D-glycero-beta-D-manno-heptose-7-phosphate kinase [Flavobacteriales bacterium]|nr:D-glycero-beta-D-manno-heptose-7-phosphate kinase [Flavobacteriales bacterium]
MEKNKILNAIGQFQGQKILVIGDVILDAYYRGDVARISPEAPVPIVELKHKEYRLGGAANVALNAKDLGATCIMCSTLGEDQTASKVMKLFKQEGLNTEGLIQSDRRMTSVKTRVISGYNQMLRIDEEINEPLSPEDERILFDRIKAVIDLEKPNAIIFEDYDKGVISEHLAQEVIAIAKQKGIIVTVDPKRKNFFAYKGATMFKPNLKELRDGLNWPTMSTSDEDLKQAFTMLQERMPVDIAFFTLSADGVFITDGVRADRLPAFKRNIADVSGAGDTVIATATCALVAGLDLDEIAFTSNLAAGWVCQFPGVVSITSEALTNEVNKHL